MVLQFGFTSDCCLYLMCFDVFVLWIGAGWGLHLLCVFLLLWVVCVGCFGWVSFAVGWVLYGMFVG